MQLVSQEVTCPECKGEGYIDEEVCELCKGDMTVVDEEWIYG